MRQKANAHHKCMLRGFQDPKASMRGMGLGFKPLAAEIPGRLESNSCHWSCRLLARQLLDKRQHHHPMPYEINARSHGLQALPSDSKSRYQALQDPGDIESRMALHLSHAAAVSDPAKVSPGSVPLPQPPWGVTRVGGPCLTKGRASSMASRMLLNRAGVSSSWPLQKSFSSQSYVVQWKRHTIIWRKQ